MHIAIALILAGAIMQAAPPTRRGRSRGVREAGETAGCGRQS